MEAALGALSRMLRDTEKSVRLYVGNGDHGHWEDAAQSIRDAWIVSRRMVLLLDDIVCIGGLDPRHQIESINDRVDNLQRAIRAENILVGDALGELNTTLRCIAALKVFLAGTEIHPLPGHAFQSAWP